MNTTSAAADRNVRDEARAGAASTVLAVCITALGSPDVPDV